MLWKQTLLKGLRKWCCDVGPVQTLHGIEVSRLRPEFPLFFLSGATPGPFYHSHPHVPAEFDHLKFDMASQVHANIETIGKIGRAVQSYSDELPFKLSTDMSWCRNPQLLHWISQNGDGFVVNEQICTEVTPLALAKQGMDEAEILGNFMVGDNVSDRRFLLETFAMFGLDGHDLGPVARSIRIDIKDEFDPKYFMPYVPGYIVAGPADLAVFSLTAASNEQSAPQDGAQQMEVLLDKLQELLGTLGASFDDVIVTWNRVSDLNTDEEAVLMTRSRKGLTRPVAEAVLGLAGDDRLGAAPDGVPLAIEYIVAAQLPR
eukprot:TRINITY_DN52847_c0_g1_i1.p1 TRINITY_DN52847_c0_g1~~TRINITY_DN52847_c0_g1_i1.p1  ORF type:complete len:317 (+),score=39.75 TRINITY_DN52847_c0_g1_i1:54-1004(+)